MQEKLLQTSETAVSLPETATETAVQVPDASGDTALDIQEEELTKEECTKSLLPIKDALDVINGKWKLHIIASLLHGDKRFKDLQRDILGITAKMLSQELKSLEQHKLVNRTVYDTTPVVVEYSLTEYGGTLKQVLNALRAWGQSHRKRIMGGDTLFN